MKLYYSPTSPFVRKVRIVAIETGLADRVELVSVSAIQSPAELLAANPRAQVPALELEDGRTIFDSAVICDYLDEIGAGRRLIPPDGPERVDALTRAAAADGI